MIERHRSAHLSVSASALVTAAALAFGAAACGGGDGGEGGAGGGATTSTTTGTNTSSNTTGTSTTTTGGGQVILSCGQNLSYVASCRVDASNYTACSDFFGNQDPTALAAQCAAGNGTSSTTPCNVSDRAGACVFFNAALSDRCYVEHIAPPTAASFWETTCPATGGSWVPAQ